MKRPSFQFYPADWQGNSNLRRCTHEEKGIWLDVLCILHDQEEYGAARWPLKEIAGAVGVPVSKLKSLVNKGILKGADAGAICDPYIFIPTGAGRKKGNPVELLCAQYGPIWYSSRMITDEYKRMVRARNDSSPDSAPIPPIGASLKVAPDHAPLRAGASSPSPSTNLSTSQPGAGEKFTMLSGWVPSDHVSDMAKQAGVSITPEIQQEFIAYWLTQDKQRTQAEWDKSLLQSALHGKARAASPQSKIGKHLTEKSFGTEITTL